MSHNINAPWRPLATAYNDHHFHCAICMAAGQGRGTRCDIGLALWKKYQVAV